MYIDHVMKFYPFISLCFLLITCITPYDARITDNVPKLVVDGTITDQPGPHIIRLSYSSAFVNAETYDGRAVSGASVTIEDSDGIITPVGFDRNGLYKTPVTFKGVVSKKYSLLIKLPNGKEYRSHPELMQAVAPLDTITGIYRKVTREFLRGEFDISVEFKDPAGTDDFYAFKWKHYDIKKTCKDSMHFETQTRYTWNCCGYCWAVEECPGCINVISDKFINGSSLKFPITTIPYDNRKAYFIEVESRSLSENAYAFWKTVSTQVNNSGGIFDSPPITIKGNFYNISDPDEQVLGFFGVSAISTSAIHFRRDKVPEPPFENPIFPRTLLPACVPCNVTGGLQTTQTPKGWNFLVE